MNDAGNDLILTRAHTHARAEKLVVIVTKVNFCSSIYKPFDVSDATIDLLLHVHLVFPFNKHDARWNQSTFPGMQRR